MNMKCLILALLVSVASFGIAEDLSGTYEFPPPDGLEGDAALVQLSKDAEGNYFAQVTVAEETIEGTNVVLGENQFSFDIEVKTEDGDMSQTYKVQLGDGEVTLSILSELGGRSESMTFIGKLLREIEGRYEFPPPEGVEGDTTIVQLIKNEEGKHVVQVKVGDETVEATNVIVKEDEFSFDTEVKTQIGNMFQSWKIQVTDATATLSMLADVGGKSDSMTLTGTRDTEETDSSNNTTN